jgi:hypothetical protein
MGLLQRFLRDPTAIEALEREINELETRRGLLDRQRAAADRNLAEAIETRRTKLPEADADQLGAGAVKSIVGRLRDEADAVLDAQTSIERKLGDARARLAAERDKQARATEGELRTNQITKARDLAMGFSTIGADLAGAMDLLASTCPEAAAAAVNVRHVTQQLSLGVEAGLAGTTLYVERVGGGEEPIRTEPAALPAAPPPAKVARQTIVCLRASKWTEADGEVVTTGRMTQASVPTPIARRALDLGNAIGVDSREYQKLRETEGLDYAWQREADCAWIDQPRVLTLPEPHVAEPPRHSEFVPPGRGGTIGTATATRVR